MIAGGESATVEFKSTARWCVNTKQKADYVELSAVKTVAAFLNAEGGTLVIGVDDAGAVLGLADDYRTLGKKPDRDGLELWLMQRLLKDFGKDAAAQLAITFHTLGEQGRPPGSGPGSGPASVEVCVVRVTPSPRPRFVTVKNEEVFYLRTGNQTQQLSISELLAYKDERWPTAGPPDFSLRSGDRPRTRRLYADP